MIKLFCISDPSRVEPYLFKVENFLEKKCLNYKFYMWSRAGEESQPRKLVIYKGNFSNKFGKIFCYLSFAFHIIYQLFRDNKGIVLCSRFETLLPVYFFKLFSFSKFKIVYLDRDAINYQIKNKFLKKLFFLIEYRISSSCFIHVIPSNDRNYTGLDNVVLLENSPSIDLIEGSDKSIFNKELPKVINDRFVILVTGWLVKTRGLDFVLETIKLLKDSDKILFIFVGSVPDEFSKIRHFDNVLHYDRCSPEDAFCFYRYSDLVLSFYDPKIEINQLAEPNKWYDCVVNKIKFVTNYGLVTSRRFENYGLINYINYGDSIALQNLILDLSSGSDYFPKNSIQKLDYDYNNVWDSQFEKIYTILRENI